jgi:recombination protein RecR
VCEDPTRNSQRICVTEGIQDLIAIERAGEFDGRYHVLHGVLSPVKGIGPDQLRIDTLIARLEPEGIEEVIVATNVDVEGEATALLLQRLLEKRGVTVTRIATGVPMGGELEYLDQVTLARALRDRRPI